MLHRGVAAPSVVLMQAGATISQIIPVQAQQVDPEDEEEEEDLEHLARGMSHVQDMKYLNSFSKPKSSSYDSMEKRIAAEEWLIHVEKILKALAILDNG